MCLMGGNLNDELKHLFTTSTCTTCPSGRQGRNKMKPNGAECAGGADPSSRVGPTYAICD